MTEGLLDEPGERLRTLCTDRSRIDSTSGVFNWRMLNAQRSTSNASISNIQLALPLGANVERWALAPDLWYRVVRLLETDQHIPQTAAGLSLSAAVVFRAVVLYSVAILAVVALFVKISFSVVDLKSAGQHVRHEQARSNGVGQCDSRSQREDLVELTCENR